MIDDLRGSELKLKIKASGQEQLSSGSYALASVYGRNSKLVWEGALPFDGTSVSFRGSSGDYKAVLQMPSGEMYAQETRLSDGDARTIVFEIEPPGTPAVPSWTTYLNQVSPEAPSSNPACEAKARVVRLTARKFLNGAFQTLFSVTPNKKGQFDRTTGLVEVSIKPRKQTDDPSSVALITVLNRDFLESPKDVSTTWMYVVLSDGTMSLTILPPTERAQIFIRYDENASSERRARFFVMGSDGKSESLLGFMSQGSFESIRMIADDVIAVSHAALRAKTLDPVAAAVGAYALLSALSVDDPRYGQVVAWARNLSEWFPSLPDGAVLSAWFQLRSATEPAVALRMLLEAEQRGIPMFTNGLKLLLDGLELFRGYNSNRQVVEAIARVRRYSTYADMNASHTTIEFDALSGTRSRIRKFIGVPNLPIGETLPEESDLARFVSWLRTHDNLPGAEMLLKRQGNFQRLSGKFKQSFFGAVRFLKSEPRFIPRIAESATTMRGDEIFKMDDEELANAWIEFLDLRARERTSFYSFPTLRGYLPPNLGGTRVGGGGGGSTFKRMLPAVAIYLVASEKSRVNR